ncbi:MAG: hypothetical protein V1849_01060 [Chloroflexota bacterium]
MTRYQLIFNDDEPILPVCPWAYYICTREGNQKCPVAKKIETALEISEWKESADHAQVCSHLGDHLTPAQWMHKRRGVLI